MIPKYQSTPEELKSRQILLDFSSHRVLMRSKGTPNVYSNLRTSTILVKIKSTYFKSFYALTVQGLVLLQSVP